MLLAEEFVLLSLTPDGKAARGASNQPSAAVGVTGALIAQLALEGHLDLTDGRIRPSGSRPSHPLLAQALDNLAPHAGHKLSSRFSSVKRSGWPEVVDAMVAAGILGREKAPLHPTRHPVADRDGHAALLAQVREAATGDGPLDPRLATLLALAGPAQLLEVVAPDRADRAKARQRIAEAAELVPTADAVRQVIQTMQAVVAIAATAGTVAGAS